MDLIRKRKDEHLDICLTGDVDRSVNQDKFQPLTQFDLCQLEHDALPEIDRDQIQTQCVFLKKKLLGPLMIGSMTGGTARSALMNQRLYEAAAHCGIGFSFGSQRSLIEGSSNISDFLPQKLSHKPPLVFGNMGAVQLNYGVKLEHILKIIELSACNAFFFHLNALQEAIQPEGNTRFSGLIKKLEKIVPRIPVPVFLKEVGCGFSHTTLKKLKNIAFAGIEVAGQGGTSWAEIEGLRSKEHSKQILGELFSSWGESTVESIIQCHKLFPKKLLIASGGIRNGVDMAKSLVLGAHIAAMALPFLHAASQSTEAVIRMIEQLIQELKVAMFVTGAKDIESLRKMRIKPVATKYDMFWREYKC